MLKTLNEAGMTKSRDKVVHVKHERPIHPTDGEKIQLAIDYHTPA